MRKLFRSLSKRMPGRRRSFALNDLDLKLEQYLNFKEGVFVEAGANDGRNQSNTLYYERHYRWRGLLVEPIPELAEQCRRNRPQCVVENYALVSFDYDLPTVEMTYCGLMSTVRGALATEQQHIHRGSEIQKLEPRELSVPAITLTELLIRNDFEHIDLMSLDVEGYELSVLQGLDMDRFCPDLLLIECRDREEIDRFLAPYYGVEAELSHHDILFRRRAA
jgi:FkbM family methyltransferase